MTMLCITIDCAAGNEKKLPAIHKSAAKRKKSYG